MCVCVCVYVRALTRSGSRNPCIPGIHFAAGFGRAYTSWAFSLRTFPALIVLPYFPNISSRTYYRFRVIIPVAVCRSRTWFDRATDPWRHRSMAHVLALQTIAQPSRLIPLAKRIRHIYLSRTTIFWCCLVIFVYFSGSNTIVYPPHGC